MRQEYKLVVKKIKKEALDAVTITLAVDPMYQEEFAFEAGQFVGITHYIQGMDVHRSYSISSSPHRKESLDISVKLVPAGKMSTFLVQELKEGELLRVTPPAGHFYKEHENKRHHVMFAAGSGVTPMISIIHHLNAKKPNELVSLFYWNQSSQSVMFYEEILEWNQKPTFNLYMGMTRETIEKEEVYFRERVSQSLLKDCFLKWSISLDMPIFYLCGPESFMEEIELFLGTKGYDSSQIRKESFFIGASASPKTGNGAGASDSDHILVGDLSQKTEEKDFQCEAVLDGDKIEVEVEENETLLEAFLRSGESPPYSCMEGTCVACMCKVTEGLVEIPKETFLSEEELKEGFVLSCQAFPKSKKLKIDFDDV